MIRLRIDCKPMNFEEIQTSGIQPEARYKHTMLYNELSQIIVICGGLNNGFYSDICILNMINLNWYIVLCSGVNFIGRCSHSAVIFESEMLVFGGYNENGYINADLVIIELDSSLAK
jgi:hypothetical protein